MQGALKFVSVAITLCAINTVIAQTTLPSGWTKSATKNGTSYNYGNDEASILVSKVGRANFSNLPSVIQSSDRPDFCNGISKVQPLLVFDSRGTKYETRGTNKNCLFLIGSIVGSDPQSSGIFVIAMERSNSKSNAIALAQTLFESAIKLDGSQSQQSNASRELIPNNGAGVRGQSPTKPNTIAKATNPVGLIGMWRSDWVENQFTPFNGLQLMAKNNTLIFTPGGYFFNGVPDSVGFDDAGAQTIMRTDPGNAGRYKISSGIIQLSYANGEQETVKAVNRNNDWTLTFRNRVLSPKLTFNSGGGLSGSYSSERISQAGSTFVVGNNDYNFSLDGRFAKGGKVSMTSDAVSSIGKRNVKTGRYEIKASALYLYYTDGTREVYSIFQETADENIWFNDTMYSNAK
jgi:hypothetical protein